ncbi:MAG: PQQ-like beta-propeller repeat protein [Acidobacteria bacterium]|nr:PQQ-like beta-propeller repeat protein [Acidobacteriota bacterium]
MRRLKVGIIFFGLFLAAGIAADMDWPQWHGPDRTNIATETGLLAEWPSSGPPVVWSIEGIGEGFGTVSIKGDRIYVQGTKDKQSVLHCLNREDGKRIWTTPLGRAGFNDKGNGPRGTPTVDGNRIYVLTEDGDLACVDAGSGKPVWSFNILSKFRGSNIKWLISESPLVDGNNLIVTPGGKGAGIVALDKNTGETVWVAKELSDAAGYSSCIAADVQGVRTIMTITSAAGVGVRADDGKLMWRYEKVANKVANVATPVYFDNKVFYTSDYGTGCALLRLKAENGTVTAEEIYFSQNMKNHHGGIVLIDGHIYGFSSAILSCIDFNSGILKWQNRSVGKGSLTYADGHLYLFSETNLVALAEADPERYVEKGRFEIADQGIQSWAHPVVCDGKLYIRNQGTLAAYDIRASK